MRSHGHDDCTQGTVRHERDWPRCIARSARSPTAECDFAPPIAGTRARSALVENIIRIRNEGDDSGSDQYNLVVVRNGQRSVNRYFTGVEWTRREFRL
jgi:hypothetical protein